MLQNEKDFDEPIKEFLDFWEGNEEKYDDEDEYFNSSDFDETIIFSCRNLFEVKVDSIFSIIPLSELTKLTIKGSKWDISNLNIPYGSSKTLRNIALGGEIEVSCDQGKYCIVLKN